MTAMVSARALWWTEPEVCTCGNPDEDDCPHDEGGWPMLLGAMIDGTSYISDRHVLMPVERLAELPVGYANLLTKSPRQAEDGLAEWLSTRVAPEKSGRLFARWLIDPLEQAGFRVRPLEGVKDAHGICDPDFELVGLVIPLAMSVVAEPSTGARTAAL